MPTSGAVSFFHLTGTNIQTAHTTNSKRLFECSRWHTRGDTSVPLRDVYFDSMWPLGSWYCHYPEAREQHVNGNKLKKERKGTRRPCITQSSQIYFYNWGGGEHTSRPPTLASKINSDIRASSFTVPANDRGEKNNHLFCKICALHFFLASPHQHYSS